MNKSENVKIQKRLSLMMAFTGLTVVIINFFRNIQFREKPVIEILYDPSVSVVFVFSIIILMTRKLESRVIQSLQVLILLANAAIALIDGYESFHGMGFVILTLMLIYRYGFLEKQARLKLGFISLFTLFFLEFAIYHSGEDQVGSSINILVYLFFFLTIIYLVYMEDINKVLKIEAKMISMEEEKAQLLADMENKKIELQLMELKYKDLERKIEDSRKPLDFDKFNITPREKDVIREFCKNPHLTTKELAFNLNMSMGTVKQHFTNIFRKLKIRNRPELLNKCKWNFK